jgi:tRNA pseudouridine13 synthase
LGRAKVLSVDRHTNKLKLGHLAGNRFAIKIRDTVPEPETAARAVLDVLICRGVPNYFGPQRFGVRGDNARIGLAVLRENYDEAFALMLGRPGPVDHGPARKAREWFDSGDFEAAAATWPRGVFGQQSRLCRALLKTGGDTRKAWRTVDHTMRKLYVSAFQSDLFNRVLAQRIATIDRLETGDIAWKHVNGACFRVEDAATEQPRCDGLEISPTGPLFGRRMTEASGTPGQRETAVLADCGLQKEQIATPGSGKTSGARRPLRVPIGEPTREAGADDNGPYLLLRFFLPPGGYATNVVREISKNPGDAVDF